MFESELEPISPSLQALLDLFSSAAASLKFPDMDSHVLETAAQQVRAQAEKVTRARAAWEAARSDLIEGQDALLATGQRALAYLRIYAEEHPDLSARLDGISLPRIPRKGARSDASSEVEAGIAAAAPRRRGRPPKVPAPDLLFTQSVTASSEAEA